MSAPELTPQASAAPAWDYEVFWSEALNVVQGQVTAQELETWLRKLNYLRSAEEEVVVGVPSVFYRDQVDQRYRSGLEQTIRELSGRSISVVFTVDQSLALAAHPTEPAAAATSAPRRDQASPPPKAQPAARRAHRQLSAEYTFDRFVEGDSNSFALNAAMAITKNPGRSYNPCLVYGGVGLGKTHLLQAIGNRVHHELADLKVVYVTVESFTNEFIQSIKDKTGHRFKNRYRSADVLLIDDIQFLQGKVETQQELFHTFNALYDAKKQMVFSSDRPVAELKALPDRLINRFERGLNVDLQPPTYETRTAILHQKVEERDIHIADEVIELICRNVRTNVRDLEKALTKLVAYAELVDRSISIDIANRELRDLFTRPDSRNLSVDAIQRSVADFFSLSANDLRGKKRTKAIAFPRQIAMYITRRLTEYSTTEVGLEFGGRDHTTVMYAYQKVEERMKTDATLEPTIQQITRSLSTQNTD
jgi:chromosomal replication initiator protein